jgi:peptide/nickel transport system substrate-binding protein
MERKETMKRYVLISLCLILTMAMLYGSCKKAETPADIGGTTPTTPVAEASGTPQYGGTLTYIWNHDADPDTWDANRSYAIAKAFVDPFMEELIHGDVETYGPRGTNEYDFMELEYAGPEKYCVGGLVESWEIPDPLTIIFNVRHGVYWTGKTKTPNVMAKREFVADDIVYGIECYKDPDITPGRTDRVDFIKTATAVDKYTVRLDLNHWESCWMYRVCYGWGFGYYPEEVREAPGGADDWKNLCGTGPFILTDYLQGSAATYEKNPDYWGTTTINGKVYKTPFLDKLIIPIMTDESTVLAALQTGKLDLDYEIAIKYRETLKKTAPDLMGPSTWKSTFGRWLAFKYVDNVPVKPFDDIRVRKAMSMAIDREAILKNLYGDGSLCSWPLWPNPVAGYYTPIEDRPPEIRENYEYNPEKARQLLIDAGYADGFETNLWGFGNDPWPDMWSMIAGYWKAIGIDCKINTGETAVVTQKMYSRDYDQMIMSSCGSSNPAENMYCMFFPTSEGGVFNASDWVNPELVDLIKTACRTVDEDEAMAMFKEAGLMVMAEIPGISLPTAASDLWWWPWVKNYYGEFEAGEMCRYPMLSTLWIDQTLKKSLGH